MRRAALLRGNEMVRLVAFLITAGVVVALALGWDWVAYAYIGIHAAVIVAQKEKK
jgi:hypothetical protein